MWGPLSPRNGWWAEHVQAWVGPQALGLAEGAAASYSSPLGPPGVDGSLSFAEGPAHDDPAWLLGLPGPGGLCGGWLSLLC